MNKDINKQEQYNNSLLSTDLNSIFTAPDDAFRSEKKEAAEQGDTQAQAWVSQDIMVDGLERRIDQYDSEISRRQDPTHVLKLEDDYQRMLLGRSQFLENNPKPAMFGKDKWQEQFDVYETAISKQKEQMQEWQEKSSPEVLSELTQRRNQKFEEMLEATGQRQKLGELPSEQLMQAQASKDAYELFQGEGAFSLSQRLKERRGTQQTEQGEAEGQGAQGQRTGGPAWAAETLSKPTDEEKMLADIQHGFVMEHNRWPKEKEVDALIAKRNQVQAPADTDEQIQVQDQTQRRGQVYAQ